ncbi:MAG: CPBP family glutamic-type intramembrane protease [Pirellulales bacterium]
MSHPPPRSLLAPAIAFEAGLAVLALGLGWLLGHPALETARVDAKGFGLGVAATLPMLLGLWGCLRAQISSPSEDPPARRRIAAAAVCWQLAGRGGPGLGPRRAGRGDALPRRAAAGNRGAGARAAGMWLGLLGASLLFGLAHAVTKTYVVLAGLVGLYLGGLWLWSGNLVAPIVAHGLYDFIAILWLLRRSRGDRAGSDADGGAAPTEAPPGDHAKYT